MAYTTPPAVERHYGSEKTIIYLSVNVLLCLPLLDLVEWWTRDVHESLLDQGSL